MHPTLVKATLEDYLCIQNLARFYVYDLSRTCGFISNDWSAPKNGLYESFDYKCYFEEKDRHAYLIKVNDELAGFILIHKEGTCPKTDWNIGEFFILAKFQGKGIGFKAAKEIWRMFTGNWEISIIPENTPALKFWRKSIKNFSNNQFSEDIKKIDYDKDQPYRHILSFSSENLITDLEPITAYKATASDISDMVLLSEQKRKSYEGAQPQFWKCSDNANSVQTDWFEELLKREDHLLFVVKNKTDETLGFIIAEWVKAPEVYNSGTTLMIDDFCVKDPSLWQRCGGALLSKLKGFKPDQVVIVCGNHDHAKSEFLEKNGLSVSSKWYVGVL
ncbi:MAG: GNAT family N-acetyltransferase [Alphaproteobacteria bacterium]|nr:GNAT family N-acetyltransferase [Alphaproteobacteria bacterium]